MRGPSLIPIGLGAVLLSAVVLVLGLLFLAPFPNGSAEFAAWAQAIGSIGAIIATAGVAWWLPIKAANDRRDGLRRMASYQLHSCAGAIAQLEETLSVQVRSFSRSSAHWPKRIGWDLSHYASMLHTFPMHELADRDVPDSFLRMQNCIVRANKVMEAYNAAGATNPRPPSDYRDGMAKIAKTADKIARSFTLTGD